MSAPLDGIRVLDPTSGMSGAIATMLLADYGAEVIRIDRPRGDVNPVVLNSEDDAHDKPSVGPAATRPWNRGKRGVQLDLDDAVDHSVLMDLVEAADVVIVGLSSSSVARFSLGLVHKARSDVGQYIECAQLSSAVFVTSHWYRANGTLQSVLPQLDHDQLGWSPERRIYQCLDGWLCVYCIKPEQAAALRQAILSSGVERSQLGEALQFEFVARTADEWVDILRAVDVPCAAVRETSWLNDFLRDPASVTAGRATTYEHHQHGRVSAVGRIVQLRNYRPNEPVRAPRLGEHSRAIAREMGVDAADVDAMIAAKVLVES